MLLSVENYNIQSLIKFRGSETLLQTKYSHTNILTHVNLKVVNNIIVGVERYMYSSRTYIVWTSRFSSCSQTTNRVSHRRLIQKGARGNATLTSQQERPEEPKIRTESSDCTQKLKEPPACFKSAVWEIFGL